MLVSILRTLIIYLLIIVAMRLMGKRQLGELQPSELVSTILISNLASISIESQEIPLSASLVPVFLIVALELVISGICFKWPKAARLFSGSPVAVIRDGQIDQQTLQALRFSMADLLEALRGKDVFDPGEVSYALIETNGSISVCKFAQKETVTREDLELPQGRDKRPLVPFVIDGCLLPENLEWCGKSAAWAQEWLARQGCKLPDVLLLLGDDSEDCKLFQKENSPGKHRSC